MFLDDVSEIPHEVRVNLSSDVISDYSGANAIVCGKNLFDFGKASVVEGYGVTYTKTHESFILNKKAGAVSGNIKLSFGKAKSFIGKTLCMSLNYITDVGKPIYTKIVVRDSNNTLYDNVASEIIEGDSVRSMFYVDEKYAEYTIEIRLYAPNTVGNNVEFRNIQVEIGQNATTYEPYKSTIYAANADGTVDGIKSLSPCMNVLSDIDADIIVDYHKSYGLHTHWNRFWDVYQNYGERTNYFMAFYGYNNGCAWNDYTFIPKYDITMTGSAEQAFRGAAITDLKSILERQGIALNTSQVTNANMMFQSCANLTHVPEIDVSNCSDSDGETIFSSAGRLHTVDKLIVRDDGTLRMNQDFYACYALQNIRFGGVIGRDISFAYSPLSIDSMKDVITHLADYSVQNTGVYTLTLKDECKTALEAEGATSPNGNLWTEYVSDLGWVLA